MVAVKRKATPNVEKEVPDDNGIRLDLEHRSFYRLSLLATRINRAIASGYVKNFGRPAHAWKVVTILGAFGPMSASEINAHTTLEMDKVTRIVDSLIEQGIVSKEFVIAVLAVDFTNPVFSETRCGLLKLVPDKGGSDFVARFQDALRGAKAPGAKDLLENLSDPALNGAFQKKQVLAFLATCQQRAADPDAVLKWYSLLAQRRVEVSGSEISQHPEGHILEDAEPADEGRIVFPATKPKAIAGRLTLTPACQVQ